MKRTGKVAVVTGGARDLGRAISVKLALEGAKVCLNYFDNPDDAQKTLEMIKADGGEAIAVQGDMTKAADVKIGFVDRFNGSLVFTGDVAAVEAALRDVMKTLCDMMGFSPAPMTKT